MDENKLIKRKNKAIKDQDEGLLISACTDLGNLYVEKGHYEFAIEEYTEICNIYKRTNKQLDYGIANRAIGEAYLSLQDFDKAIHHQMIYLNKAKEMRSKVEEQRALATIGYSYLTKHSESPNEGNQSHLNSTAYDYFTKSLKVYRSLTNEVSKLEKEDMFARLLCNMGVAQERLGNFEQGERLINESITSCKRLDIYEQLVRGYMCLASIFEKRESASNCALQNYNLAVETAEKIKGNPNLLATALTSKADILVKLGDLIGAKSTLYRAYKLKLSIKEDHANIERCLKVVVAMCRSEKTLLSIDTTDYRTLKDLYEKLGDGACELKSYKRAIDYYKKMLECAQKAELADADLATCIYSLAETFKDDQQFKEAVDYYEMEVELRRDNLLENLNTLSKIADVKESSKCKVPEVVDVYQRAADLSRKFGNSHEEGRMVKRCVAYLRRHNRNSEAFKWERKLDELHYASSDSEEDNGNEQILTPTIGDDVSLENISDVSGGSDAELDTSTSARRSNRTSVNFVIKKNMKGETQLHTACIQGKLNVVQHLLRQGHPINVRDHCGWLPLHEACICGHLEIVQLLIEKGAAINDRGGTQCSGRTPLHDAACNGHLEVIKYLLEKGANPVAKTDEGQTALNHLNEWYHKHGSTLDRESRELYEELSMTISDSLDKVGEQVESSSRPQSTQKRKKSPPSSSLGPHSRRTSSKIGLEEPLLSTSADYSFANSEKSGSGAEDYRNVMESLRRKSFNDGRSSFERTNNSKRPALVEAEFDWLEDDVSKSCKKRKTNSPIKQPLATRRLSSDEESSNDVDMSEMIADDENLPQQPIFETPLDRNFTDRGSTMIDVDSDSNDSLNSFTSGKSNNSNNRPKTRQSLIDSGFSSERGNRRSTPSLSRLSQSSDRSKRKYQSRLTSFGHTRSVAEADSTCSPRSGRVLTPSPQKSTLITNHSFDQFEAPAPIINPMLSVDVRIDGKLFRVPVLMSQVNTYTIKWLAEQASTRYAKKEYMKPSLELETKSGAILADDDPLNLLFPAGATVAEPVEGRITKRNIPPLIDRFKDACNDLKIDASEKICEILTRISTSLDFSNRGLNGVTLSPLCKSLNKQSNLLELNLSGNFPTTECFKLLSTSLPSLENLHKLNLNSTSLITEHLQILSGVFANINSSKLKCLDLSDNYLNDDCFEFLSIITNHTSLKELNLSSNQLCLVPKGLAISLKSLESLDISGNLFKNSSIVEFVNWLEPSKLKILNCSNNDAEPGLLGQIFTLFLEKSWEKIPLQHFNLSRCHVQDSELLNFSRLFENLEILDLSYNPELTGISFERLIDIKSITQLNLCGCSNILRYHDAISDESIWSLEDQFKGHLKITVPLEENEDRSFRLKESLKWIQFEKTLYFYIKNNNDSH